MEFYAQTNASFEASQKKNNNHFQKFEKSNKKSQMNQNYSITNEMNEFQTLNYIFRLLLLSMRLSN